MSKFSSTQVVMMAVSASVALILAPVAVSAATGSSVNIVDPCRGVAPTG
jgi:hypothetical protein